MKRLTKNFLYFISFFTLLFIHSTSAHDGDVVDLPAYEVRSYWLEPDQREDERLVYSHATLGNHHSSDIASVLQQATPDVGIIRKAGTSNDIHIRGLSQDNLSLSIDDGFIFPCCSNRMDPPVSQVSSAMIQSIELTQGAFDLRSVGSLGGSVKITTKEPSVEPSLQTSFTIDSFEQVNASVFATGGENAFSTAIVGEYSQSKPYKDGSGARLTDMPDSSVWMPDNYLEADRNMTAFKALHANAKVRWVLNHESQLNAHYRYRKDEDVLYPGLRMDADLTQTHELGVSYDKTPDDPTNVFFNVHVYHNWTNHDMRDSHRYSSIVNAMGKSRPQYVLDRGWYMESLATGSTSGIRLEASKEWTNQKWETGLDYMRREWDINNRLGAGIPTAGPAAEIFNDMIPDTCASVLGVYVQSEFWIGDDDRLDYGLRIDRFETEANDATSFLLSQMFGDASKTEWMPSAKLVYRHNFSESISYFAGVGSTARIPNGQERYMQLKKPGTMPNWLGQPDLDAPRNTEILSGFSLKNERVTWNTKAFYSFLNDYIYIGKLTPQDDSQLAKNTQTYFNIDARLYGIDSSITVRLLDHWSLYSGLAWQRGRKETLTPNNTSKNLGEIPSIKGMGVVRYSNDFMETSFETVFAGSQDKIDPAIGEQVIDAYVSFNLRTRFVLPNGLSLAIGVENLADTTYATHNSLVRNPFSTFTIVNESGRLFYLSINGSW